MDDKCRKCWIPVHLLSHSVCNIQVSVSRAQCKALETGSPRRQWSCLGALPAGRRGCSHELPWMLMEPCRGLGGKPQEEFPAEIPGRQAGAGREQTQGRGREGRRPWDGGGPRVGGTVPRRSDNTGPASSEGRNTRHVNVNCAAVTLHHLGAGWGGEGRWLEEKPSSLLAWTLRPVKSSTEAVDPGPAGRLGR